MLKQSRIPDNYIGFEFSDFVTDTTTSPQLNRANAEAVEDMQICLKKHKLLYEQGYDLFITGGAACGKTLIASVILRTLILKYGYSGLFITAEQFLLMALDKIKLKPTNGHDLTFEDLAATDFLLIDNFHIIQKLEKLPEMVMVVCAEFIKRRKGDKKPMIITSQMTYDQIQQCYGFVSEILYTVQQFRIHGSYSIKQRGTNIAKLGLPVREKVRKSGFQTKKD